MTVQKNDKKVFFGQKAFITKGDKLLVLRDPLSTVRGQSGLDFPGGKYRWGESLEEELKREVREETGLEITIGKPFAVWTSKSVSRKTRGAHMVLVGFLCKYISGKIKLSDEHDYYEWIDKNTYNKWQENTEYFSVLEQYFKDLDS